MEAAEVLLFGDEEGREEEDGVDFEKDAEGEGNVGSGPASALGGDEAEEGEGGRKQVETDSSSGKGSDEEIEGKD